MSFGMRGDHLHHGRLTNRIELEKAARRKPSRHAPCGHEGPNLFGGKENGDTQGRRRCVSPEFPRSHQGGGEVTPMGLI